MCGVNLFLCMGEFTARSRLKKYKNAELGPLYERKNIGLYASIMPYRHRNRPWLMEFCHVAIHTR